MPSLAHAVYFWFSLTFLITRTLAVSLYAADINDESKKPTRVLRAVPRESWCLEVGGLFGVKRASCACALWNCFGKHQQHHHHHHIIMSLSRSKQVKRFSDEVTYDVVGLSGMKFFHITRKLVLSVSLCKTALNDR